MLRASFYDPERSYEENYAEGPFGAFADGERVSSEGEPAQDFFGFKVYAPFGIPAGPLLNSAFCAAAFRKGFDICVYKTVRSSEFPCHPFPNVLAVREDGNFTLERLQKPLLADREYREPLSITNSFGVPSRPPAAWQEDVRKAVQAAGKGQVLVLSFMGTVRPGQTEEEFVDDYRSTARLAAETGALVLEANLSCPNIGNEGLVCYNLNVTEKVAKSVRAVIGATPLVLKVGYYTDDAALERLAEIADAYADSVSGINTLQAEVRDAEGNQALPGPSARLRSGVCGAGIKWAGLDFVRRLHAIRARRGFRFSIEGVGGVASAADYAAYKRAGADSVMSATGAMWNPQLAEAVKREYPGT